MTKFSCIFCEDLSKFWDNARLDRLKFNNTYINDVCERCMIQVDAYYEAKHMPWYRRVVWRLLHE